MILFALLAFRRCCQQNHKNAVVTTRKKRELPMTSVRRVDIDMNPLVDVSLLAVLAKTASHCQSRAQSKDNETFYLDHFVLGSASRTGRQPHGAYSPLYGTIDNSPL